MYANERSSSSVEIIQSESREIEDSVRVDWVDTAASHCADPIFTLFSGGSRGGIRTG
jgi:hypothetical protein